MPFVLGGLQVWPTLVIYLLFCVYSTGKEEENRGWDGDLICELFPKERGKKYPGWMTAHVWTVTPNSTFYVMTAMGMALWHEFLLCIPVDISGAGSPSALCFFLASSALASHFFSNKFLD